MVKKRIFINENIKYHNVANELASLRSDDGRVRAVTVTPTVTWAVELLPPRDVEHFPVDCHEDPGVLEPIVGLQLCEGEISLLEFGQRRLHLAEIRRFVPAEDLVEEEQTKAEQRQVQRGGEDLLEKTTRSYLASFFFSHVGSSLCRCVWVGPGELAGPEPTTAAAREASVNGFKPIGFLRLRAKKATHKD